MNQVRSRRFHEVVRSCGHIFAYFRMGNGRRLVRLYTSKSTPNTKGLFHSLAPWIKGSWGVASRVRSGLSHEFMRSCGDYFRQQLCGPSFPRNQFCISQFQLPLLFMSCFPSSFRFFISSVRFFYDRIPLLLAFLLDDEEPAGPDALLIWTPLSGLYESYEKRCYSCKNLK